MELQEFKKDSKLKISDLRRDFIIVEKKCNDQQFGDLPFSNKEQIDGGAS